MSICKIIFEGNDGCLIKNELAKLIPENITPQIFQQFYEYLKAQMIEFTVPNINVFDVCGTGGSGLMRVNISTILAIVLAKGGTAIAKHAGRASSGKIGSVDIVEKLGLELSHNSHDALLSIERNNYSFLFAPDFHPKVKQISDIRREINTRTIINFLMPLLNPVSNLKAQMIGVSNLKMMDIMADIAIINHKNVLFVHDSHTGLDDVSITGKTIAVEVFNGAKRQFIVEPHDLGFEKCDNFSDIAGFDHVDENLRLIKQILDGSASKNYRNFLEINKVLAIQFFNKLK